MGVFHVYRFARPATGHMDGYRSISVRMTERRCFTHKFVRNLPHPSHIRFFSLLRYFFLPFSMETEFHTIWLWMPFGVKMGTDHRLKFPAEQPIRKFHSDLMRQFREISPGAKSLHQMESLHAFSLCHSFFDLTHISKAESQGYSCRWPTGTGPVLTGLY